MIPHPATATRRLEADVLVREGELFELAAVPVLLLMLCEEGKKTGQRERTRREGMWGGDGPGEQQRTYLHYLRR